LRLDGVSGREFIDAMTPLFEGAPRFLARLERARPFGSPHALFERARDIALAMPETEQVELVDAHPRLGADPRSVSALSFEEQGYDGPEPASDVAAELERLNDAYEQRFGFRYCVFVAGRSREELLPGMRAALDEDRASELRRALVAVVDIANDRYAKREAATTARQAEAPR
jgi:2-oxo-4-hydroxy-4-carboxy--5-ureidoimidazoline (OHCU) decarboxylase